MLASTRQQCNSTTMQHASHLVVGGSHDRHTRLLQPLHIIQRRPVCSRGHTGMPGSRSRRAETTATSNLACCSNVIATCNAPPRPSFSPSQRSGNSGEHVLHPQHSISQPWLCPNANLPEVLTCIRRHQLCRFAHFTQLCKVLKHPREHHFACKAAAAAASVEHFAKGLMLDRLLLGT